MWRFSQKQCGKAIRLSRRNRRPRLHSRMSIQSLLPGDHDAEMVAENSDEACYHLWRLHQRGKLQLNFWAGEQHRSDITLPVTRRPWKWVRPRRVCCD